MITKGTRSVLSSVEVSWGVSASVRVIIVNSLYFPLMEITVNRYYKVCSLACGEQTIFSGLVSPAEKKAVFSQTKQEPKKASAPRRLR